MLKEGEWRKVGKYNCRPLYQDYNNLGEKDTCDYTMPPDDVPIILYDTRQEDGGILAPRYIATKVSVPQNIEHKVKILSRPAQKISSTVAAPLDLSLNCSTTTPPISSSSHTSKSLLVVATTLPQAIHTVFALPLIILLADIAVTAAGLTTLPTSSTLIGITCLLVLIPDVLAIALILRRGRLSTSVAIHVALWPCVAFFYLFPFVSVIFVVHILLTTILILFLFRLRVSTHTTFLIFQ